MPVLSLMFRKAPFYPWCCTWCFSNDIVISKILKSPLQVDYTYSTRTFNKLSFGHSTSATQCQTATSLPAFSPSPMHCPGLSQCQAFAALHDYFLPSKQAPSGSFLHHKIQLSAWGATSIDSGCVLSVCYPWGNTSLNIPLSDAGHFIITTASSAPDD